MIKYNIGGHYKGGIIPQQLGGQGIKYKGDQGDAPGGSGCIHQVSEPYKPASDRHEIWLAKARCARAWKSGTVAAGAYTNIEVSSE